MSEETTNTEQDQGQEPAGEATPDSGGRDWEKLFKESTLREKKLNERLTAIEQSQAEAKEAEERKQLEAKGEYETIVEQLKAQNEATVKAHQAELLRRDLGAELIKAGARNEVFINGAIASFKGSADDIAQYVADLKEPNADFFGDPKPVGQKGTGTGTPATRSNAKSLDERLADGDQEAQNEALRQMLGMTE
jgi:hypothetical protein